MIGQIMDDGKARMEEVIVRTKKAFASVRTGRANPALLDRIMVSYYGTPTPLNQMASVSVPEPRMLVITPWDKSSIKDIEKAILTSDLGLVPNNDGSVIRLAIPPLDRGTPQGARPSGAERRGGSSRCRAAISGAISMKPPRSWKRMAKSPKMICAVPRTTFKKLTDRFIEQIDELLKAKEKEIMEV